MRNRLYSELKRLAFIICIGVVYYIWVVFTDLRIPCPFNLVTGFLCPGCGITRMIMAMSKFDFESAFTYNKFIFVTWPLIAVFFLYYRIRYIKTGCSCLPIWAKIFTATYIIALFVFAIIRNII